MDVFRLPTNKQPSIVCTVAILCADPWIFRNSSFLAPAVCFTDPCQCLSYLNRSSNCETFIIVSNEMSEHVVPLLITLSHIVMVYIANFSTQLPTRQTPAEMLNSAHHPKILGPFASVDEIVDQLMIDVDDWEKMKKETTFISKIPAVSDNSPQLASIVPVKAQPKLISLKEIAHKDISFVWFHLLIEVIFERTPIYDTVAMKEKLFEACSMYDQDREHISILKSKYLPSQSIQLFVNEKCIRIAVERALRTDSSIAVFYFRHFIANMYNQLSKTPLRNNIFPFTVFSEQYLSNQEIEKLTSNVGNLMSTNSYFLCFSSWLRAQNNADNLFNKSEYHISKVLFEIVVQEQFSRRPFSKIQQSASSFALLFSIGSIFRINSAQKLTSGMWYIKLTAITDAEMQEIRAWLDCMVAASGCRLSDLTLWTLPNFFMSVGNYDDAAQFYDLLANTDECDGEASEQIIFYNQAVIASASSNYDRALTSFQTILDSPVKRRKYHRENANLEEMTIIWAPLVQNCNYRAGILYNLSYSLICQDKFTRAFNNLQHAEDVASDTDLLLRSYIQNNKGCLFFYNQQFAEALHCFQNSLDVVLQFPTSNDECKIRSLTNIAAVVREQRRQTETKLNCRI